MGPIETLDRSFWVVRHLGFRPIVQAILGGAGVGFVLVTAFFVERVESVRGGRPWLAGALVMAWWIRSLLLSGVARRASGLLWSDLAIDSDWRSTLRLASVVGIGLGAWAWVLMLASYLGPVALAVVLLFSAIRGMVAPSWLARAGACRDPGLRGWLRAAGDSSDLRFSGVLSELVLLVAWLLLTVNLLALLAGAMLLSRSVLGLDIALLAAFLSPSNAFVLLLTAAAASALLEPLRAARSAVVYVNAKVSHEGLDLRRAIRRLAQTRGVKGGLLALCLLAATPASAQPGADERTPAASKASTSATAEPHEPPLEAQKSRALLSRSAHRETRARELLREILQHDEYAEIERKRQRGLDEALEALRVRLREKAREWVGQMPRGRKAPLGGEPIHLPSPLILGGGALLLAALVLALARFARHSRRSTERAEPIEPVAEVTPPTTPAAYLDEATRLAQHGRHREALRAVFLATLVELDRGGVIELDRTKPNGYYLRLPSVERCRAPLRSLMLLIDGVWYGQEAATEEELERGRALSEEIGRLTAPARRERELDGAGL